MAKIDLNKLMEDIVSINNQVQGLNMLLANKKHILAKYFQKTGNRSIRSENVTCYQQDRTKITYDIPSIKRTLPKDKYKLFINDKHYVIDWDGFVRMCKAHNISPKELRPFISVESEVDQEKLKKLYDKKVIGIEDLEGCYDATVTSSVALKFNNVDKTIPM